MKIELWPIANVKPYPGNPRQNDDAVDAVAASLKEYGFHQPLVVDAEGVIICGHTRYKAAQKLGLDKVPVHVATDLSPEQVRAYRIADNQTASLATWDYDLLPIELASLKEAEYDLGRRKTVQSGTRPELPPAGCVLRVARFLALAIKLNGLIRGGAVENYAELARLGHVTRARVTQILNLLSLATAIQEEILFLPLTLRGRDPIILRDLLPIAAERDWKIQKKLWRELIVNRSTARIS